MRFQYLLYFSLSLATRSGLVGSASLATAQVVTIQRLPLNSGSDALQQLTTATAQFKASNSDKIERAFVGVVSDTAEQVFVWKSPGVSSLDTTTPFKSFSSSGSFSSQGTAVVNDRATLLSALTQSITETIVTTILPDVSTSQVETDLKTLVTDLRDKGFGIGGVHGISTNGNTRTILSINGWFSSDAPGKWVAQQSGEVAAAFTRITQKSYAAGTTALYKSLNEV
ncbi:hypothetical protein L218DRAFT_1076999 [Marasmius fiardii PR-910]|nr:hypothetical protein L218DRAFT_1076999 [Marasmius fiardii PR-910]